MPALDRTAANIRDAGDTGPGMVKQLLEPLRAKGFAFTTTVLGRLRSQLQDALYPVVSGMREAKAMRGISDLPPSKNPETLLRLWGGLNDKYSDVLEHGMVKARWEGAGDCRAEGIGGGLDWLVEKLDTSTTEGLQQDMKRLSAYMVAQRVLERAGHVDLEAKNRMAALHSRAELLRDQALERVEKQAAVMRRRAEVRAGKMDAAREKSSAARELASEQGRQTDEDLAGVIDRGIQRQQQRLERIETKLQERIAKATGADRARLEKQLVSVRDRAQKRVERLTKRMQEAEVAHDRARDFSKDDVEREIQRMHDQVERRHQTLLGRIGRFGERLEAAGKARKARLAGIGGGVFADDAQARQAVDEVLANPQLRERMDESARRYRAWANASLQYLVDKGRLSPEAFTAIKARNEQYVAMHRAGDGEDLNVAYGRGAGRRLGSVGKPVQAFKGGTRLIENPYVNLLTQTHAMMKEADRNEVLARFADLLDVNRGMYQGDVKDLAVIGQKAEKGDEQAVKIYRQKTLKGKDGVERTTVVEEPWKFEPGISAALKSWGEVDDDGVVAKIMQIPKRMLQGGVTLSPPFLVRNVLRDSVNRAVVSKTSPLVKVPEVLKGFSRAEYERYQGAGGGQAGHYMSDAKSWHQQLQAKVKELSQDRSTLVALPGRLWKAYKTIAHGSELVGRMAEYRTAERAAKAKGLSDYEASLDAAAHARGLIDYAVAGTVVRKLNKYIPFLNPAIQGVWRAGSGFWRDPKTFTAKWATYVLAPTLATYALNAARGPQNEEEYRNFPAWRRDLFWNVKVGDDLWVSIPKPFELGALAGGVERLIDRLRGDQNAFHGYAGSLAKAMLPADESVLAGPFKPIVETLWNHDSFTGKNIVPDYEESLPVDQRKGTAHASRIGQAGQWLTGIDSRKLDHVLRGFLGNTGSIIEKASDIGRSDRAGLFDLGGYTSGITTHSPAADSRAVDIFRGDEADAGRANKKPTQRLQELLKEQITAPTPGDKDRAAAAVRAYARGDDPLQAFDRTYADLIEKESERDHLVAMAKASRSQDDVAAARKFVSENTEALGPTVPYKGAAISRAQAARLISDAINKLDRERESLAQQKDLSADERAAKAADLQKRMRAMAAQGVSLLTAKR
jgi:hypothetical protein